MSEPVNGALSTIRVIRRFKMCLDRGPESYLLSGNFLIYIFLLQWWGIKTQFQERHKFFYCSPNAVVWLLLLSFRKVSIMALFSPLCSSSLCLVYIHQNTAISFRHWNYDDRNGWMGKVWGCCLLARKARSGNGVGRDWREHCLEKGVIMWVIGGSEARTRECWKETDMFCGQVVNIWTGAQGGTV